MALLHIIFWQRMITAHRTDCIVRVARRVRRSLPAGKSPEKQFICILKTVHLQHTYFKQNLKNLKYTVILIFTNIGYYNTKIHNNNQQLINLTYCKVMLSKLHFKIKNFNMFKFTHLCMFK